jgi:L-amino acid N-acyltransferase YncA
MAFIFYIWLQEIQELMQTEIQNATAEDLPTILEIINYNILNTTALYEYSTRSMTDMEQWFRERQEQNRPVIVAIQNDVILGYGTYGIFRVKEAFKYTVEHSVYVSHEHTGKGIGKLLLAKLIQLAKDQGMHTMVGCIDAENTGSIDFHKKFGFTEAGIIKQSGYKFNRWLDLQFMQLMLED